MPLILGFIGLHFVRIEYSGIKKLDVFNLEKRLPNFIYKIPYEILNRMNRNNLKKNDDKLVSSITYKDYELVKDSPTNLDLFLVLRKN